MADKFTNNHFMDFCNQFLGQPYWYGTCVHACTEDRLRSKKNQYPTHYGENRMKKYRSAIDAHNICSDCVGLMKGYFWTNGGEKVIESIGKEKPLFTNKYASNGMPDQSANGMFTYAKNKGMEWGVISTIPEIRGLAVRYDGHVGYYDGNGYVIEERGFNYGCVKTRLKDRKWTHWYKIPGIEYEIVPGKEAIKTVISLGSRNLKKGMKGSDVKELQEKLIKLKYDLGKYGADGDFGAKTDEAVRKFQTKYRLTVDGIFGKKSLEMLKNVLAEIDAK